MMRLLIPVLLLLGTTGCANIITSATNRMADNLSVAILNQDDPQTVKDGAPAYLLLIDSFVEGEPDNPEMLLAGARLYGAYASVFVDESERAQRLTTRAREYAERAACLRRTALCEALDAPFDAFTVALRSTGGHDVPVLHGLATAWAGWIRQHSDDWQAVADVPKVRALLERVVELDEQHDGGSAHLYLGVIHSQLPPAMGGRPEVARAHFERAIELSEGRDLMAKVLFAQHYARLMFDQELHDRLLEDVLAAAPEAHRLTLTNTLAQRDARRLLAGSDDYF
ncbi:MAG TPA: hypothetical protein ENN42_07415 [Thioalkalivibrio sp.]|nr:hypothetical protein [Thioalkalivibrio sp.]